MRLQDRLADGVDGDPPQHLAGVVELVGGDAELDDAVQRGFEIEAVGDQVGDLQRPQLALSIGLLLVVEPAVGGIAGGDHARAAPGGLADGIDLDDLVLFRRHRNGSLVPGRISAGDRTRIKSGGGPYAENAPTTQTCYPASVLPSSRRMTVYRCSSAARTRATVSAGVRETCSTKAATSLPVSGSTSILSLSASAR